ncbi:hypothetical protein ACHAWO_007848 [Cyclotella atomus]|uniref:Uncharacterized protein n=1 Tax=Cyclotella atomus TaxID=382360 RepID=A0ABD3NP38_9STRA
MMDANEDWVAESHKQQGNKLKDSCNKLSWQTLLPEIQQHQGHTSGGRHRLDYILVDPALLPAIRSIDIWDPWKPTCQITQWRTSTLTRNFLFKGLINRPTEIHSREFMICQDDSFHHNTRKNTIHTPQNT